MIEALFHVSEVANDQAMEALLVVASKTGIELPEGDLTPADLALLIWLYDPDLLRRANCERIVLRFQSFYCFMNRTLEAPTFESPTDQVLNRIADIRRPVGYDVVVYNIVTGELRIRADLIGERRFYCRLFSEQLFGDPEFFEHGESFNLDVIYRIGEDVQSPAMIPSHRQ